MRLTSALVVATLISASASAQVPPSPDELAAYGGLHTAAATGDLAAIEAALKSGAPINATDPRQRTPLHVAIFQRQHDAARALIRAGADPDRLEFGRYDIITIAAVANDTAGLRIALEGGGNPRAITSIYDGTALIAAAHLGHAEIVRMLIEAGAPLDHINNLGWTALMESIVLGDGGEAHADTLAALVKAGADVNITDRAGVTPLQHARRRGYGAMTAILTAAGGR
jgi:ankyrin repeat protein